MDLIPEPLVDHLSVLGTAEVMPAVGADEQLFLIDCFPFEVRIFRKCQPALEDFRYLIWFDVGEFFGLRIKEQT